jgi:hypothetical protein
MGHRAVRGVAADLPQSKCVEEVHLSCKIAEPRQQQEPTVWGPGDGVPVGGSELIYALCLAVEQRDVARHIARCYYKS